MSHPLQESGAFFSATLTLFSFLRREVTSEFDDVLYTRITNYVAFIGYTILVWDHIITFGDEVRFIWTGTKKLNVYLFFLNRYFTPLAFIGNLTAYFSKWSEEVCRHFVRYEGSCTVIAVEVTGLMMLMRVKALYAGRRVIIGSVIFLLAVETGINVWLMMGARPVPHDGTTVRACTMLFDPNLHSWASLSAWLPLLYDTYVTLLMLYACMPRTRHSSASHIVRTLMRDGMLYYGVIFCLNLVLAIMIVSANDAIKNITAQLQQMLTVAMMSRITLSLRREGARRRHGFDTHDERALDDYYVYSASPVQSLRWFDPDRAEVTDFSTSRLGQCGGNGDGSVNAGLGGLPSPTLIMPMSAREPASPSHKHKLSVGPARGANANSNSFGTLSTGSTRVHSDTLSRTLSRSRSRAQLRPGQDAEVGPRVPVTAIIAEPSQLSEQNVYELRMLRPHNPP